MIHVTNTTSKTVSVAINQWGGDGHTAFSPSTRAKVTPGTAPIRAGLSWSFSGRAPS
jgi:hypothetical protein